MQRVWWVACAAALLTATVSTKFELTGVVVISQLGANTASLGSTSGTNTNRSVPQYSLIGNGFRQHYQLGLQFRQNYQDLVSLKNPNLVRILAAGIPGASESAAAFFQGVWGAGSGPKLNNSVDKKYSQPPVPDLNITADSEYALPQGLSVFADTQVHRSWDNLFFADVTAVCPSAAKEMSNSADSLLKEYAEQAKQLSHEMQSVGVDLKGLCRSTECSASELAVLGHKHWTCRESSGESCLLGASNVTFELAEKLRRFAVLKDFAMCTSDDKGLKLLTNKLGQKLIDPIPSLTGEQILYLAGTNKTLLSLFAGLEVLKDTCMKDWISMKPNTDTTGCIKPPRSASILVMEYWKEQSTGEQLVDFFYDNTRLELCGRYKRCSVQQWQELVRSKLLFPGSPDRFCGNVYMSSFLNESRSVNSTKFWLLTSLFSSASILLILVWFCRKFRSKKPQS